MNIEMLTSKVLFDLGLLHDCKIKDLSVEADRLNLELEDVHANTLGLPEYPGIQPAVISVELKDVDKSVVAALKSVVLPAKIYELEMTNEAFEIANTPHVITLRLSPNGCFELPMVRGELRVK